MSQQQQPGLPIQQPGLAAPGEAYRQGFLDGHLAGWKDALAAQAQASAQISDAQVRGGHSSQPVQTGPAPVSSPPVRRPPNQMPQTPAFGIGSAPGRISPREPQQPLIPQPPMRQPPMPQAPTGAPMPQAPMATQMPPGRPLQQPPTKAARLDPAATAARKLKRETQNINITLYVASLLMVAAAALFVGSNLPAAARLVGVWTGTALFYAAGMFLHGRIVRLRPAAVAFTGTALAIIPFAGLATYNLGFPEAPAVWLATSLIGTVAYIYAAVRLQSRLVVYLSLAFLLSTAWSSVAVLGAALAWYFTALIVFAALLTLAGHLLIRSGVAGGRAPSLYAKPLSDLGPWFAPVGLAGSLAFGLALNAADHALVLVAGVIYYAVMVLVSGPSLKRYNYLGLRLSLTLAAPFIGWMIQAEFAWAAGAFTIVLAAQALFIAYSRERIGAYLAAANWVRFDVFSSVPVMVAASFMWSLGWYWAQEDAGGNTQFAAVGVGVALLASLAAVPAFLPRGEWLPLPAAGAILLFAPFLEAAGWTALLAVALTYTVLRHLTTGSNVVRHGMLVGGRILATALVASSLAAFVPAHPGKAHLILTVIAVIAALQLLADTLLAKYGAANPVTRYSAAAWAVAGAALVAALSSAYAIEKLSAAPDAAVTDPLRLEFLVAALAVGIAAAAYSLTKLPRAEGRSGAELIAPSYFILAALLTGPVFAAGGASIAWAVAITYLVGVGVLLRGQTPTLHRWLYWWGARVVSLALAVALFQLWREVDRETEIAGAHVGLGLALLLVLVAQIGILTGTVLRGKRITGLQVDVIVTLSAVVVVGASSVAIADAGLWTTMVVVGLVATAVAALAMGGTLRREPMPAAVWAGPAAMVATALWTIPDRPLLALVLGIIVLMSAVLAAKSRGHLVRAAHFLLARVAVTALVGVAARELSDNLSVVSLVVTGALLVQVVLQYVAIRVDRVTVAVGEPQFLQVSLWLLLAAQVVLPVAYYAAAGGFAGSGTALRWVVAVELLALAVTSIVAQAYLLQRGASYLALLAVMGGAAVIAPVLWPGATALILLALTVAVIAWRCAYTPRTLEMRWYWLVATACLLVTACIVDSDAATGIFAGMWLVAGLALIVGAHLMKSRWLTLPGSLMVFLAAVLFRSQVLELTGRPGYSALAGFAVVMGTLFVVRLLLLDMVEDSQVQRGSLVGTALGGGAFLALWTMFDADMVLLGAAAFTVVAVLACMEVPAALRRMCVDAAVVSCAAVWFWACSEYVDLGAFWAVQWCALALGALAVIRYVGQRPAAGRGLLVGAASFASLGALLTIFSGDTLQQVISLLVFVALLAVGMSLDERIFTVWGAVGVATAVIWYLRGFTYILLALLALALIGFVIWRLNRRKPNDAGHPSAQEVGPAQPGHQGKPARFGAPVPPQGPPMQEPTVQYHRNAAPPPGSAGEPAAPLFHPSAPEHPAAPSNPPHH